MRHSSLFSRYGTSWRALLIALVCACVWTATSPSTASAAGPCAGRVDANGKPLEFVPLVCLENTNLDGLYAINVTPSDADFSGSLTDYLSKIFFYAITIGGILAVLRIAWAGFLYITTDIWHRKSRAVVMLQETVLGLCLLLAVWLILNQINPQILSLKFNFITPQATTPIGSVPPTEVVTGAGTPSTIPCFDNPYSLEHECFPDATTCNEAAAEVGTSCNIAAPPPVICQIDENGEEICTRPNGTTVAAVPSNQIPTTCAANCTTNAFGFTRFDEIYTPTGGINDEVLDLFEKTSPICGFYNFNQSSEGSWGGVVCGFTDIAQCMITKVDGFSLTCHSADITLDNMGPNGGYWRSDNWQATNNLRFNSQLRCILHDQITSCHFVPYERSVGTRYSAPENAPQGAWCYDEQLLNDPGWRCTDGGTSFAEEENTCKEMAREFTRGDRINLLAADGSERCVAAPDTYDEVQQRAQTAPLFCTAYADGLYSCYDTASTCDRIRGRSFCHQFENWQVHGVYGEEIQEQIITDTRLTPGTSEYTLDWAKHRTANLFSTLPVDRDRIVNDARASFREMCLALRWIPTRGVDGNDGTDRCRPDSFAVTPGAAQAIGNALAIRLTLEQEFGTLPQNVGELTPAFFERAAELRGKTHDEFAAELAAAWGVSVADIEQQLAREAISEPQQPQVTPGTQTSMTPEEAIQAIQNLPESSSLRQRFAWLLEWWERIKRIFFGDGTTSNAAIEEGLYMAGELPLNAWCFTFIPPDGPDNYCANTQEACNIARGSRGMYMPTQCWQQYEEAAAPAQGTQITLPGETTVPTTDSCPNGGTLANGACRSSDSNFYMATGYICPPNFSFNGTIGLCENPLIPPPNTIAPWHP